MDTEYALRLARDQSDVRGASDRDVALVPRVVAEPDQRWDSKKRIAFVTCASASDGIDAAGSAGGCCTQRSAGRPS